MKITDAECTHFQRNGFFLVSNPLGKQGMREVDFLQQQVEPEWEATQFPQGFNRGACQFFLVGEPLLRMVETPEILQAARQILGDDNIHVGACGLGDASKTVAADGRAQRQVHWHADGGPEVRQVSLRTALDRHDASNAPLRVLPGSQHRPRQEMITELLQLELATGTHDTPPDHCFARHPDEVEVVLDPRFTLVWTPSCWHATGVKTAAGPRRAMAWNYYPTGGRTRDVQALQQLLPAWEDWSESRKKLWGLID